MISIDVEVTGELRPRWLIRLEDAIDEARAGGWNLKGKIIFEGHPYIWDGEPKMATWTTGPDHDDAEENTQ